ncbi:MAG: hypothetical protein ACMUIL_12880 [bacterium]
MMPRRFQWAIAVLLIGGTLVIYLYISDGWKGMRPLVLRTTQTGKVDKQDGLSLLLNKERDEYARQGKSGDIPSLQDSSDDTLSSDTAGADDQHRGRRGDADRAAEGPVEATGSTRILDVDLADIAYYDESRKSYVLNEIDLYHARKIPGGLVSLLKVLNRKDMPSDYFRWGEYQAAYEEIDLLHHDAYIWPFFTNPEAKTNLFLHLFTRYASDNQTWRTYEKDKADCSQFSQRIYLFLSPEEIHIPDEDYFAFLFSDPENRSERKKLCNKIPGVLYTTIIPYTLKREGTSPPEGHAMISFAPDDNPDHWILGEPQSGAFERFGGDVGRILNEEYTRHPLLCRLGNVTSIEGSDAHEAITDITEAYLFPRSTFWNSRYAVDDPRGSYSERPIRIQGPALGIFDLLTTYVTRVVNNQPTGRSDLVRSLEIIAWNEALHDLQMKDAVNLSMDAVMHGVMDLDKSDVRMILDSMTDLEHQAEKKPGFSPQAKALIREMAYLFRIKCTPFL